MDDVTYSSSVGGELKDYNAAIAAQTIPALEGYLRRYPEGTNAARIKVNLKSLNGKVDSCLKDAELFIQMGYLGDAKALLDTAGKINPDDPRIQVLLKKAR